LFDKVDALYIFWCQEIRLSDAKGDKIDQVFPNLVIRQLHARSKRLVQAGNSHMKVETKTAIVSVDQSKTFILDNKARTATFRVILPLALLFLG